MTDLLTDDDLVQRAADLLDPRHVGDRLFGNVASVLVTADGNLHGGVCVDTGSGTGYCAELAAIAAMITAREHRIERIVAVWRSDEGVLHVLPPCGRCRLFIHQVDAHNLETTVLLGRDSSAPLRELLPLTQWPEPY